MNHRNSITFLVARFGLFFLVVSFLFSFLFLFFFAIFSILSFRLE